MKMTLPVMYLIMQSFSTNAETQLEFKGTLIAEPCQVSTDSQEQEISFSAIALKTFVNNPRSLSKPFQIKLMDCDLSQGNSVSVAFDGERDLQQQNAFSVTGGAKGVAIILEDKNGNAIKPGIPTLPQGLQANSTILEYRAFVQSRVFSEIEEGPFESIVTFSLQYE